MDERDARLRSHEQNICHYQNILKTPLSEVELHFVEKRLSEERFKIAMLELMNPPHTHQTPRANEPVGNDPLIDTY